LQLFRFAYVGYIVTLSAKTFLAASTAQHASAVHDAGLMPSPLFVMALAATETLAALLFLSRKTELVAGTLLLGIYAIAMVADLSLGQIPVHLAFYAVVAVFIVYASRALKRTGLTPA
jgi:hypothetical protein